MTAAVMTMAGCKTTCNDCNFESVVPSTAQRAFLLYLATDNSLSSMGNTNLRALAAGATEQTLGSGVMFVLHDSPGVNTKLEAIYIDPSTKVKQQKTVKTYSTNLDTSLPATLTTVWGDIQKITKAEQWILSFGSHGNGWFPGTRSTRAQRSAGSVMPMLERPTSGGVGTRALLEDNDAVMGPDEFAAAVPNAEMIIMDACDMGCIEFAYLLKDKAKYLILSPAEVIDNGFPYDKIVDDLFNTDLLAGAKGVCTEYYNFYDNYHYTSAQYATVSLFDTSKLGDYATAMKTALSGKWDAIKALTFADVSKIKTFDRSGFQLQSGAAATVPVMYDMKEFLSTVDAWSSVEAAQQALILYYNTTGKPFNDGVNSITIEKDRFSGVCAYIPANPANFTGNAAVKEVREWLTPYWEHTLWAQAVGYPGAKRTNPPTGE